MPSTFDVLRCDVAVIGAGTAGLAAERSARQTGARTLLVDDGDAATTCASTGCMPSKLLIAAAHAAHAVRRAHRFGVHAVPTVDGAAVLARVRSERDRFVAGVQRAHAALPDGVALHGRARFIARPDDPLASSDTVWLGLDDGRRIAARAVVLATGSAPRIPPSLAPAADRLLTNATVFELAALPASLGVVGAGPLGLELAQAFARLGVDVEVFDDGSTIAGLHDATLEPALRAALGGEFRLHTGVVCTAAREAGGVRLAWSGAQTGDRVVERLLVAAGRSPQLQALDLGQSGLVLDAHGIPVFDPETMQCGRSAVFIAGDADGERAVLHEAAFEGTLAGENAATHPRIRRRSRAVALAIGYTDPQFATVGAAPSHGDGRLVGRASFEDQGRARVEARNVGGVRLDAEADTGRLTGAVLVGPAVEHLAHLLAWAIAHGDTATALLGLPFYHPSFEEGLKPALREICRAARTVPPSDDDALRPGS